MLVQVAGAKEGSLLSLGETSRTREILNSHTSVQSEAVTLQTKGPSAPIHASHPRDWPCSSLQGSPGLASEDPWLAASQGGERPQVRNVGGG